MTNISIEDQIWINKVAQGFEQMENAIVWFSDLPEQAKLDVLRYLSYLVIQAGANQEDVTEAVHRAQLKNTLTPCVLLLTGVLKIQISKALQLPASEYRHVFLLLLSIFSVADDRRRREKCKNSCNHWWHQDLQQNEVVNEIKRQFQRAK